MSKGGGFAMGNILQLMCLRVCITESNGERETQVKGDLWMLSADLVSIVTLSI